MSRTITIMLSMVVGYIRIHITIWVLCPYVLYVWKDLCILYKCVDRLRSITLSRICTVIWSIFKAIISSMWNKGGLHFMFFFISDEITSSLDLFLKPQVYENDFLLFYWTLCFKRNRLRFQFNDMQCSISPVQSTWNILQEFCMKCYLVDFV